MEVVNDELYGFYITISDTDDATFEKYMDTLKATGWALEDAGGEWEAQKDGWWIMIDIDTDLVTIMVEAP